MKCSYECRLANGLIEKNDGNDNGGVDTVNVEIVNNP